MRFHRDIPLPLKMPNQAESWPFGLMSKEVLLVNALSDLTHPAL